MSNPAAAQFPPPTPKVDFTKEIDRSSLKGQSILVTGGANGIGEAFAEALAKSGAYVTIFDIQDDQGQQIVKRLGEKSHHIQFVQGDVRSWDDQIKAFDSAISFSPHRALDIVLIVAGVGGSNILQWLDKSATADGKPVKPDPRTIDVNLTAAWYTTHLALHYLRRSVKEETRSVASKQIVFVSSIAGYSRVPGITDYAASKWGVRGLWRSIRESKDILGRDSKAKFRTSLIAPWVVNTNMAADLCKTFEKMGIQYGTTSDAVDVMLRIVCDEDVDGRAITVVPNGKSFDMCDDMEGYDGGREWPQKMVDGEFGGSMEQLTKLFG